jgi:hypothetical protein
MVTEVFIVDVLKDVVAAMQVPVPASAPVSYFTVNYNPGRDYQIMEALKQMDGTTLGGLKYPLVAVVMPIPENYGSGYLEVTFPRVVIAYLTKTGTRTEPVLDKYNSTGVFKTILRPCLREFITKLAWSTFTNMGDPDAYEYTSKEQPCQQPIGEGLTDYVDIIEILNLKAIIFPQIKSC